MGQVFDWDGTITGIPMSMVVRDQPFYTSSLCEPRPHWGNMSICPHRYISPGGTGTGYPGNNPISKANHILRLVASANSHTAV